MPPQNKPNDTRNGSCVDISRPASTAGADDVDDGDDDGVPTAGQGDEEDNRGLDDAPEEEVFIVDEGGCDVPAEIDVRSGTCRGLPARYTFAVVMFFGSFTIFCLRTSLSVAIVAMVNSTVVPDESDDTNVSSTCPGGSESDNVTTEYAEEGEFTWDEKTQGLILSAFYYGYLAPQPFGGWLANRIQGKKMFGGSVLLSSLLSFAIPSAARAGASYLIAVRVLQGVVECTSMPALHVLCSEWVPVHESSKLVAFAFSGCEMGALCGMLLTGFLCRYGFAGGWPSAFYIFGIQGCVCFLLLAVLVYDSPAQHPRISATERRYIESSVGDRDKHETLSTPWRDILTSAPVWGVCIAHFCFNWGYYSMFTCLPTYMKQILHFRIVTNGFLSAVPYLLMWVAQVTAGIVSDWLRRHTTTVFTRKLMLTIGSLIPASFLVAAGYVECDHVLATVLLTTGVSGKGIAASCVMVNHLDFAPRFTGILFGMSNSIASIPGFVAPSLIGILTNHNQTIVQWRKFFYITAAIYGTGILCFLWLGRGEQQSWAAPKPTSTTVPTPLLEKETNSLEDEKPLERLGELG